MKTQLIEWGTPCKLIGAKRFTCYMNARTAAAIVGQVKRHGTDGELVRMDIHEQEAGALESAIAKLGRGWGWAYSKHRDELRDRAGFARFIFWRVGSWRRPAFTDRRAWLRAYYTDDELLDVAESSAYDHRVLWPDADGFRRFRQKRRDDGTTGGLLAARNKDGDILTALLKYKRRNPTYSMTTCCVALVKSGELKYRDSDKLIDRLSRMGKRMTPPMTPKQLYEGLK